jgi:ADP-ribosylglycohydrolase/DNA-binding transcriptional regulator YhcF (GntR family)
MRPVRRTTLPALVAEEIRRDIIHGSLAPGTKLPTENKLSKQLGAGRPAIREALRILEGQGWIKFKFSEGAYVMDNTTRISQKTSSYLQKEEVLELLEHEIVQLEEEGKEVIDEIKERFQWLKKKGSPEEIEEFYNSLEGLDTRDDYPYKEPSEMGEIKKEVPGDKISFSKILDKDTLYERIYGAWLGRCIGCLLGKPVEGWPKEEIENYLRATDTYPLQDYFSYAPDKIVSNEYTLHPSAQEATRGNIKCMPRDDDLDYTILNLKLVEENSLEFTTDDVAEEWLWNLPYQMVYTAERQTYANLVRGIKPPATAVYRNPFREWIGAQIRADVFGYLAPGNPELAASLAYKDASLSHTKNGIYGEMFIAAALSAALVSNDLGKVIDTGLSQVPRNSRLTEVVRNVIDWSEKLSSWQKVWKKVDEQYGNYHFVHTLPNLAFVLIGLLWGELDFKKTISIAVTCGYDTDCNGATAGSIIGALRGIKEIPEEMSRPLNDRIKSIVSGHSNRTISDLARRTVELAKKNTVTQV